MTKLVVHHLETSRSTRVLWLLEELGLDYELKCYPRDANMRAPAEFRQLHRLGKAPIVVHGDRTLAESGAILEYCLDQFDHDRPIQQRLRPEAGPDLASDAFLQYRYWLHYAEGSLMSPLLLRFIFDKLASAPMPFFVKPIANAIVKKVEGTFIDQEIQSHTAFLEQSLGESKWFAGEQFSAADIQMIYGVEALLSRGRPAIPTPNLKRWQNAAHERAALKTAIARGGELMLG